MDSESYDLKIKSRVGDITSAVIDEFRIPIRSIFDPVVHLETLKCLDAN